MTDHTRRDVVRAALSAGAIGAASRVASTKGTAVTTDPRLDVTVTMDGDPKDAQLVVRDADDAVAAVGYTDVHDVGHASLVLEPGEYELEVDAGGGHVAEREYRTVTVDTDGASVAVDVTRRFDPNARGWYAADPHAHSQFSADSDTPIDRFAVAQLAADLDVLFITDHNAVGGHTPLKELARKRGVPYVLGEELTTDADADDPDDRLEDGRTADWGHFNVYPLPENRLVDWTGDPVDFFADAREAGADVVQANHPRRDGNYFHRIGDEGYDPSFDTVEVYNGGFGSDEAETIDQLFAFWNEGKRYTAVSVTDDHHADDLGEEYGSPRTYVYLDQAPSGAADAFAEAITNQHAFVSYGPLVYFEAKTGAIPGDTVHDADGQVTLTAAVENVGDLTRATLVKDGESVRSWELSGETATFEHETAVSDAESWFVVRVQDASGAQGTRAMTNPIYVSPTESDG